MAVDMEVESEAKFAQHDWSKDETWQALLKNLDFTSIDALNKRQRKFYKENYDSNLPIAASGSLPKPQEPQPASPSSSTGASKTTSGPSASTGTPKPKGTYAPKPLSRNIIISLNYARLALCFVSVTASAIFVVASFLGFGAFFYKLALGTSVLTNLIYLFVEYGIPQISTDYAMRVVSDENTSLLFGNGLLIFFKPAFLALLPPALRAILFSANAIQYGLFKLPQFAKYKDQLTPLLAKVNENKYQLNQNAANYEVFYGFFMIVTCILARLDGVITVALYWQYLRMRYILSDSTKTAFFLVRQQTDKVFRAPWCPKLVTTAYDGALSFLNALVHVNRPTPGQAPGMPSCVIS